MKMQYIIIIFACLLLICSYQIKRLKMKETGHHFDINKLSFAGLLVTLGIVYGDIGTSPLYTVRAIINSARNFQ